MRTIRRKRALVTGAASGIGRAISLALAKEGADLHLVDLNASELEAVAAAARAFGVQASTARCDLVDSGAITHCLQDLLARWPAVDIVVNNAGVAYHGPTDKMTAEQWQWLLGVNLLAPIQIVRELLPTMLALPEAHIVNVCSIFGLIATDQVAAYHTSKYGLVGFSESLRAEYLRRGLGVTALCPGLVDTNLFRVAVSGREQPVPQPPAWLCTQPSYVARQAIRAIYSNRGVVVVSGLAKTLWYAKRLAPGMLGALYRVARARQG